MSPQQDQVRHILIYGVDVLMVLNLAQSNFMSNGACAEICTDEYAYAVIIGQSCYCSNDVPATQVSTDECHDPCPGYPPEFCGNATAGYYAYFNLGRAASATVQLSTATANSSSSTVAASTASFVSTSTGSASTVTSTNSVAIQQYIQSALSSQTGPDATDACFLNGGNTQYTSPSWYQNAPTQVQNYFSATHQDTSVTCAALADSLFPSPPSRGLSGGAKAGIIVGSILGALLIIGLVILLGLCLRRRRRRAAEDNSNMHEKMDETPNGVGAAAMPTHFDDEHSSEHGYDEYVVGHGGIVGRQQPRYHEEATVTPPLTATPAFPEEHSSPRFHGSPTSRTAMAEERSSPQFHSPPTSRTAMAAAALAWGREHPHDSPNQRSPAQPEHSVTDSQASSVYETPYEALPSQQTYSTSHNRQQYTPPEPAQARTSTEQDFYISHQQSPYHFPTPPAGNSPVTAHHERSIPRKPVGILKNKISNERQRETGMAAAPVRRTGQRDSDKYTFYDEQADDDYPYHAR